MNVDSIDHLGTLYLDCHNDARVGHVPLVDTNGKLVTGLVRNANIAPDSILQDRLSRLEQPTFSSTVDGNFVADGVATMPGASGPFTGLYVLTRDVHFRQLVVKSGITIQTDGYRLFAGILRLHGTAIVHNDGVNGLGALGQTARAGGQEVGKGSISYTTDAGRGGGNGGSPTNGAGLPGAGGARALSPALGGVAGRGGNGAAGGGSGAAAGAISTVTAPKTSVYGIPNILELLDHASLRGITGGAGGSGGGGGGAGTGVGGGGGGGGSGGGVCLVAAAVLDLQSAPVWTGRISANGGDGGAGGTPGTGGGLGGAGGGGGGGAALVVTRRIIGNPTTSTTLGSTPPNCIMARGGALGSGNTTSSTNAGAGFALLLDLSGLVRANEDLESGKPTVLDARPVYRPRRTLRYPSVLKP